MMIGAVSDATFGETTAQIQPGTRLYLFSDGSFEAENIDGSHLGMDDFVGMIVDSQQQERGRAAGIWEAVRTWQGRDEPLDDFSLLEIEFS